MRGSIRLLALHIRLALNEVLLPVSVVRLVLPLGWENTE